MSSSQHPVAASLSKYVSGPTLLLGMVMGLPLIDGVFAAVIISGGLTSIADALQVGLLLIGGSATLTVILTELHGSIRTNLKRVAVVGTAIILFAAVQAAVAPTIESLINTDIFVRFAALVLFAIGARHASARLEELLPTPGMIIALGLLASFQPNGAAFELIADTEVIGYAVLAAVVGVVFATVSVLVRDFLVEIIHIERFRLGGGLALSVIGLSLVGLAPQNSALVVLALAFLLSLDRTAMGGTERQN